MVFWRKKNNPEQAEQEAREARLLHPKGEPALEPTEDKSDLDAHTRHEIAPSESEIIEDMKAMPAPAHNRLDDVREAQELSDHTNEGGWFSQLAAGLSKTTGKWAQGLSDLLTKEHLEDSDLETLEEILIAADLGPQVAAQVIDDFSRRRFAAEEDENAVRSILAQSIAHILMPVAKPLNIEKPVGGPFVILVCGVNGAGKTTTIGKIAYNLHYKNKMSVMLAAGDTFRAAAVEQLQIWAERSGSGFMSKDIGADAAALAFEAYEQARREGRDVLIIDTAGRLQNKTNLMEELRKIQRVLKKQDAALPHACLLILDATTGQNAIAQVETFKEMVDVTGLVVTKLDGSAKGGVLVGLAGRFGLPVHLIGVGEGIEDLQPFDPDAYARILVGFAS